MCEHDEYISRLSRVLQELLQEPGPESRLTTDTQYWMTNAYLAGCTGQFGQLIERSSRMRTQEVSGQQHMCASFCLQRSASSSSDQFVVVRDQ